MLPAPDRKDVGMFYPIMGHMCHLPVVEVGIETGKMTFRFGSSDVCRASNVHLPHYGEQIAAARYRDGSLPY